MEEEQRNRIITKLLQTGDQLGFDPDGWSSYLSNFLVGTKDEKLQKVQDTVDTIIDRYRAMNNITKHDRLMLRDCGMKWEGEFVRNDLDSMLVQSS